MVIALITDILHLQLRGSYLLGVPWATYLHSRWGFNCSSSTSLAICWIFEGTCNTVCVWGGGGGGALAVLPCPLYHQLPYHQVNSYQVYHVRVCVCVGGFLLYLPTSTSSGRREEESYIMDVQGIIIYLYDR